MQQTISHLISFSVLLSNIFFIVLVLFFIFSKNFKDKVGDFVYKNILYIVFTLSLGASLGSLIYSNILGFNPCELCWYQRIFLYPQVILSFYALRKGDKDIVSYLLPLSFFGFIISLYQSLANWGFSLNSLPCLAEGGECSKLFVYEYGYITIPFMAFSIFTYLIAISFLYKRLNK
jgi:disulfide bond formation protein DsbB